jgi:tetratricopeptide (TPR) repeat protein
MRAETSSTAPQSNHLTCERHEENGAAGQHEVRMHRLIQEMLRLNIGAETMAPRETALVAHVIARAEFLWDGWAQHEHRWELVPLVAFAWQWLARGAAEGAYLANQAFGPLRNLGKFAEAEPLVRRALAIDERTFGPNHPNVATCLNNLAALLHDTNRMEEAELLYRRALAIDEHCFGEGDPKVATCLNNLAQLLQATGRLQEAEPLYRRALTIDEQGFGVIHPRVAVHLNNLAELLKATDRLDEAEPFYRRALAIDEQRLGPDHPRVASHLSNLVQLLQATARLEEAKALCRRALAIDEQHFGPNHPNVGMGLNNLAALLAAVNRLDDAESLMRIMLRIFLRSSASTGHEHHFLKTAIRNYAALLAQMGRSTPQVLGQLNEVARPFGINFGSRTLSETARQCQDSVVPHSQPTLSSECRTVLTFLVRKAVAFLGFGSGADRKKRKRRDQIYPR